MFHDGAYIVKKRKKQNKKKLTTIVIKMYNIWENISRVSQNTC